MKYELEKYSNFCLEQEYKETKKQMLTNNNLSEFFYISKQNNKFLMADKEFLLKLIQIDFIYLDNNLIPETLRNDSEIVANFFGNFQTLNCFDDFHKEIFKKILKDNISTLIGKIVLYIHNSMSGAEQNIKIDYYQTIHQYNNNIETKNTIDNIFNIIEDQNKHKDVIAQWLSNFLEQNKNKFITKYSNFIKDIESEDEDKISSIEIFFENFKNYGFSFESLESLEFFHNFLIKYFNEIPFYLFEHIKKLTFIQNDSRIMYLIKQKEHMELLNNQIKNSNKNKQIDI